uniref:Receptor L-domain domain-containing protein n=1 Tax=Panagrellus redivivus TaxID=6233 RepID=A0A7E4WAW2_PANRE
MINRILLTIFFSCVIADEPIVEYTENGALLIGTGSIKLNNNDPMTFEIENLKQCEGDFVVCYKSSVAKPNSKTCAAGYQQIDSILGSLKKRLVSGFVDIEKKNGNVLFILARGSPYGLEPDIIDGFFEYQFIQLPKNCKITVLGATDPNLKKKDPLQTAKIIFYVLGGLAGLVLLIALGAVIYCLCIKHKSSKATGTKG